MFTMMPSEQRGLIEVGTWTPAGVFVVWREFAVQKEAERYVHYLNGGDPKLLPLDWSDCLSDRTAHRSILPPKRAGA